MPPLPRRAVRAGAIVCLGMALSACAGGPDVGHEAGLYPVPTYTGGERFVWCVPYARQISGISIRGDADTWWGQASGRYARGNRPAPYAVLALKPTRRLSDGHIGVVTGLVGPREIRVSHANWGWTGATRGRVYTHMPVIDVSSGNDWTAVRFKHPAVGAYGRVYPALGFIYSPKDPNVRIARASPPRPRPAAPARVVARPVRAASPPAAPAPVAVPHTNATLRLF
ncbi:CHAP domain-containing protein [Roseospira visakhapatnamensis]|uniref:Peptidase C51 domain-containing protein n=1 Tax=Roseospira visakhapatnamensis TaxID=390880 RepID=A0A7W6WBL5_9PROT|nr:CHAP domain-containing protein [Roseospira visakhapatnamensis]MBB4267662.1 hypothetical protein [Roseospira visakhapatnamensis]